MYYSYSITFYSFVTFLEIRENTSNNFLFFNAIKVYYYDS